MQDKTNVMRLLDGKKLKYNSFFYGDGNAISATEVATYLGQAPERVFKTLVTVGKSGKNYVFVVPGCDELDLKKAAKAVGEKSIAMIPSKELLPLTGYIHGGCSPIGMKKFFTTTIHRSAKDFDTRPDIQTYSSVLVGERTEKKTDFETSDTRSLCEILRDKWLIHDEFDSVRDSDEFKEIIKSLF